MTAEQTRLQLLAQHERLRDHLRTCSWLAAQLRVGGATATDLDRALDVLRHELAVHNELETAEVRRLLHGPAAWGSLLVDRMLQEHVAEHAAFWALLSGTRGQVASQIDELAEELDAHMAAEERTFLAPITLRDDVIRVRTREEPAE